MKVYLERKGYFYSAVTVHKYMNTELGLRSIVRPQKPEYGHGKPHKVFDNKLNQNFYADEINRKWCTDFTYLFLANHEVRYNCTIIDLHDRSVIASITDRNITSDLAIRTLRKALESQPTVKEALYQKVEEFAYVDYNHVRPHSFNGYRTPYEARTTT